MNKIVEEYFNENSDQIKNRFFYEPVEDLKIGGIVNKEFVEFLKNKHVAQYTSDYFSIIQLRADFCIKLLEHFLYADQTECKTRFVDLHRGTPYYFIALGRLTNKDFEGFSYFMDMAIVQDNKNMDSNVRKEGSAAEKSFLGKTDWHPNFWMDNEPNEYIFGHIEEKFKIFKDNSQGSNYKISQFKSQFVESNLQDKVNPYHSVVSSFYSWVLECRHLVSLLSISPPEPKHIGSMEPYYLHLVKGALILESIGKMVIHKKTGSVYNGELGTILNGSLNTCLFGKKIKITQWFGRDYINTLDDILKYVATQSSFDKVKVFNTTA